MHSILLSAGSRMPSTVSCWQSSQFRSKKQEQLRNGIRNSRREQWSWEDPISRLYKCDFLGRLGSNLFKKFAWLSPPKEEAGGSFHTFMLDQSFSLRCFSDWALGNRRLAVEMNQGNAVNSQSFVGLFFPLVPCGGSFRFHDTRQSFQKTGAVDEKWFRVG